MRRLKRLAAAAVCFCFLGGALASCGGGETDEALVGTFTDLLAKDFEVYYLFYSDGLPVDEGITETIDGVEYHPAASSQYRSLGDLRKLLESVYTEKSQVEELLGVKDPHQNPLLTEKGGKLYRSATRDIFAMGYELEEDSVRLERREDKTAHFVFEETGLDGSLYEGRLSMTKTSRGWRLDGTRADARRELVREGSGESSLFEEGEARKLAQSFLDALTSGDGQKIAEATWEKDAGAWAGVRIRDAEISDVREELASHGDYLVTLTVEEDGGILPMGPGEYRLQVGVPPDASSMCVLYFRPAGETFYNWLDYAQRESESANQVLQYIEWFGDEGFLSPEELPPETVAEYAMLRIAVREEAWDRIFPPEEIRTEAESAFGIEGFDGSNTRFFSAEQGGYLLWGRGGLWCNMLMEMPQTEDGRAEVTVRFYEDVLCTRPEKTLVYVLEENPDGSWRFLWAKKA